MQLKPWMLLTALALFAGTGCPPATPGGEGEGEGAGEGEGEGGAQGVGGACTSAADCSAGLDVCNDDPGGQCTHGGCNAQADCADISNAVCEFARPGNCYKECTTKADCPRDGYDCIGGPNQEGNKWCDIAPGGVGGSCVNDASCDATAGLTCVTGDPGGTCEKSCSADGADAECGDGAICVADPADATVFNCYAACTVDADCGRADRACVGGTAPRQFCDVP